MRRPVLALTAAAVLLTAAGASSAATLAGAAAVPPAVPSTPVTAPFVSPNVTHVGTIPIEGVGVSMETRTVMRRRAGPRLRLRRRRPVDLRRHRPDRARAARPPPVLQLGERGHRRQRGRPDRLPHRVPGHPLPARRRRERPDAPDDQREPAARRRPHRRLRRPAVQLPLRLRGPDLRRHRPDQPGARPGRSGLGHASSTPPAGPQPAPGRPGPLDRRHQAADHVQAGQEGRRQHRPVRPHADHHR